MIRFGRILPLILISALAALLPAGLLRAGQVEPRPVQLLYATFDPLLDGEPSVPPDLAAPPGSAAVIIQLVGSAEPAWIADLAADGVVFDGAVPRDAYLARLTAADQATIAAKSYVRWVGLLHPAYKFPAGLGGGAWRILLHADADVAATATALTALGADVTAQDAGAHLIRADVAAALLPVVAGRPEVRWIQADDPLQTFNDDAGWVSQAHWRDRLPLADHGITGAGQVGGVADSGLAVYDFGGGTLPSCFFVDDGNSGQGGAALPPGPTHRKVISYSVPAGAVGDLVDGSGHGTHVVGSVVGDGGVWGVRDSADGQAWAARVVFQDIGTGDLVGQIEPPDDYGVLFGAAYDGNGDGIYQPALEPRTHSNSWGSPTPLYSVESAQTDAFMWQHPDFLILYAAGNQGPAAGTIGYPATAKSIVTVGAGENGFADTDNLLFSSSHGPAPLGRLKPEVIAPGDRITSALRGAACATTEKSGTSMATPTVHGMALLLRQYLWDGYYPDGVPDAAAGRHPSAALLKALLINSGRPVAGDYSDNGAGGAWPSHGQGWGRVTVDDVLYFPGDRRSTWLRDVYAVDGSVGFTTVGQTETVTLTVHSAESLKITLAWTDYPGDPLGGGALVNNLDLTVTGPDGALRRGNDSLTNDFHGVPDLPLVMPDAVNPWEVVYLAQPVSGTYTLTITAASLPSLALDPGRAQGYALVATGDLPDQRSAPPAPPSFTDNPLNFVNPPALADPGIFDTDGTYTLTWSAPETTAGLTHYVVQEATDLVQPLRDDAEGAITARWSTGALLTPWTASTLYAHSGSGSYWSGRGDAVPLVDTSLTLLTAVTLPGGVDSAELTFYSRYFNDFNDYGHVEIELNHSGVWTPLRRLYADPRLVPPDTRLQAQQFDLSAAVGVPLRVRFRYDNGVFSQAPDSPGWWLDDITITGGTWQTVAVLEAGDAARLDGGHLVITGRTGGTYGYRVRGVFADGSGTPWSNAESIAVQTDPTAALRGAATARAGGLPGAAWLVAAALAGATGRLAWRASRRRPR